MIQGQFVTSEDVIYTMTECVLYLFTRINMLGGKSDNVENTWCEANETG